MSEHAEQGVLAQKPVSVGCIAEQVRGDIGDVVSKQVAGLSAVGATNGFQRLNCGCLVDEPFLKYHGVE
jgi:hypothetical protein